MDQPQKDWLNEIGVAVTTQEKLSEQQNKKEAILGKLARDREMKKMTILEGTDLQVTRGKKREKTMGTLDYDKHDQKKEMDLDEQRDGYRIADVFGKIEEWNPDTGTQEQFEKQLAAQREVNAMVLELEREMTEELDANGNPTTNPPTMVRMFSDEEIATEIYDPLKRRGFIPETSIPDKFSRTKEMLDGSFKVYQERLEKEGTKSMFEENFALGRTLFTSTLTIVGSGLKIDSDAHKSVEKLTKSWDPKFNIGEIQKNLGINPVKEASGEEAAEFSEIKERAAQAFEFINMGMGFINEVVIEGGEEIYEELTETEFEDEAERREKAAPKLATGFIGAVASALGEKLNVVGLGVAANTLFGTLTKAGPIVEALAAEKLAEKHITEILDALSKGVEETLKKFDPGKNGSTAHIKNAYTDFGVTLHGGIKSAEMVVVLKEGKFSDVVTAFAKGASASSGAIGKEVTDIFLVKKNKEHADGVAGQVMKEEFEKEEEDKGEKPKHKPEDKHKPDWIKQEGTWMCAECIANGDDARAFAGIIDRKIRKLKRDQDILNWGATIGGMAFEVASTFIAPLAIGGAALKMAKNIKLAIDRWSDFRSFCDRQQRMMNAASPFMSAAGQFVYNSGVQGSHYTFIAASEGLKMIGAILQCTAVGAHAGAGITAGANIAEAVEAVVYEVNKRLDLEKAWRTYRAALTRPENRKLGLIAVNDNPTLAKYAMAWGACHKKDPLVSDFLTATGLNADSMKDPGAKVHKVVEYLEARLPDDNVVVGRKVTMVTASWAPGTIELTITSWLSTKALGETKGGLMPADSRAVDVALGQLTSKFEGWKKAAEAQQVTTLKKAEKEECLALLENARAGLSKFITSKTEESGGGFHAEMNQIKQQFMGHVKERTAEVTNWAVVDP